GRPCAAGRRFGQESSAAPPAPVRVGRAAAGALASRVRSSRAEVQFLPGDTAVDAEIGASLLEVAESAGLRLEAGCRMGVCGADPVAVVEGTDGLSLPDDDELTTLRRLGHAASNPMARFAPVQYRPGKVAPTPQPAGPAAGH